MSNSAFTKFELKGLDEIRRVLRTLPTELQDKVMRTAVARAARPLVNAAKTFAGRSRKTGALQESIGAIVKKGKRGGVFAVVGPQRGYFRRGVKIGKGESAKGADAPANYGHLVEFGHHVVAPIKGTTRRKRTAKIAASSRQFVPAKPFMRPALVASANAVASEMAHGVADGIDKQLQRLVKNPKAIR